LNGKSDLPPRAQRRNLSRSAYENDLEASRRWKREHPEEAARHCYETCACGNRMARQRDRCRECWRAEQIAARDLRRSLIADLWESGATAEEIAFAIGSTRGSISVEVSHMRSDGWKLRRGRPKQERPELAARVSEHRELIERVRHLLRVQTPLPVLSDREATLSLRPHGQGVKASPQVAPVNHARPTVSSPVGARGERSNVRRAGNSRT